MELQKQVLDKFIQVYKKPTFKEIAEKTGLNVTRVFRLYNGQKMRLDEYQKFKSVLSENIAVHGILEKVEKIDSQKILQEVETYIDRLVYREQLRTNTLNRQELGA